MKHLIILSIILSVSLFSCQINPEPINYNHEECAFCKMKISDIRFGAEMVTSKGKIYKYDSAECLVQTYLNKDASEYAYVLVTDYINPRALIDAKTATFLISENQPSPMGGNLSAYQDLSTAKNTLIEKGGKLLTFNELLDEYR